LEDDYKAAVPLDKLKRFFVRSVLVDKKKFREVLEISKLLNEELGLISAKGEEVFSVFFDPEEYGNGCQVTAAIRELQITSP
jgi:hypothetical protein